MKPQSLNGRGHNDAQHAAAADLAKAQRENVELRL
jgi:hypothetical protein